MSTTLEILVKAQDQASGTLKEVAASGKAVGTNLQASSTKGSAAIASTERKASSFGATLKKVGAIVGVAFAATAVYHFGKEAVAAFEGVEKQQKLLEVGLKGIGQEGQLDGLVTSLKGVSDETVTLQANTDQVAAAVLNVGHNYFDSLGSEAGPAVAGLTKGILNISAATHKSLSMLQRSLTLAVINTPDKAVGTLQKLGIVTEEQAAHFTHLAATGDLVTLKQEEVNAITNAYPGAAGDSATAGEKLAKSMDDIKIKLGAVLVPIVGVISKIASFAAKNTALVTTLIGAAGLVYALTKIVKIVNVGVGTVKSFALGLKSVAVASWTAVTGLVADTAAAIAFTAAEGVATVATLGLSDALVLLGAGPVMVGIGAALAAGLAVGTALNHIFGISEKLDRMLVDNSINAASSVDAESNALVGLKQRWENGLISAQDFTDGVDALNKQYGANFDAANIMAGATQLLGTTVEKTAHKVTKFAGMAQRRFHAWAKGVKADATSQIVSLGGVDLATKKTARDFLKASDKMAKVAKQDAIAMKHLADKSQDWVPKAYKEWLLNDGPGAVANFEQLTTKGQHQAVKDWAGATKSADSYKTSIESLSPKSIDAAAASARKLRTQMDAVKAANPINIDVFIRTHGQLPHHAAGGYISQDEIALVGERGPEVVALPGGSRVYPSGTGPSAGAVRAGAMRGSDPIVIKNELSLDRRRFVTQSDFDSKYRGY